MRMNGETTLSTIPRPAKAVRTEPKTEGSEVDWETIRRKVLDSTARLAWIDDLPQEVLEQAWAQRAIQVAQMVDEEEAGEQVQVVVIRLGREVYGLETDYVFDIRPIEQIARVPRVPDWVAGVANLRGRIISVLDLRRFLGLPRPEKQAESDEAPHYLVVVETQAMELALLVDEVLAIEALPTSQVQEDASAVRGIQAEYVRGIFMAAHTGDAEVPLMILNLPALLADKRLIVHEDII